MPIQPTHIAPANVRVVVLVSRFNEAITGGLLQGATSTLEAAGVPATNIRVETVPGAVELPLAAAAVIRASRPDAVIALGAVVRGETDHYEHVARMAADGLMRASLDLGVPVAFGVLTCATEELAIARSSPDQANKGREAALAALEMVEFLRRTGPGT